MTNCFNCYRTKHQSSCNQCFTQQPGTSKTRWMGRQGCYWLPSVNLKDNKITTKRTFPRTAQWKQFCTNKIRRPIRNVITKMIETQQKMLNEAFTITQNNYRLCIFTHIQTAQNNKNISTLNNKTVTNYKTTQRNSPN